MKTMQNIADLPDPNDAKGRSYREINNATNHFAGIGSLVELPDGCRLHITDHRRDCDGTPLYCLGVDGTALLYNYSIGGFTVIKVK